MAQRRITSTEEALAVAFEQIRELQRRLDQPRTRVRIGRWTISQNAAGDLVMRNINGTTHVFPK